MCHAASGAMLVQRNASQLRKALRIELQQSRDVIYIYSDVGRLMSRCGCNFIEFVGFDRCMCDDGGNSYMEIRTMLLFAQAQAAGNSRVYYMLCKVSLNDTNKRTILTFGVHFYFAHNFLLPFVTFFIFTETVVSRFSPGFARS